MRMYVHSFVGGRYISWHVSSSYWHVSVACIFITVNGSLYSVRICMWLLPTTTAIYLHHLFMKRREHSSLGSRHVCVSLIILLNVFVY